MPTTEAAPEASKFAWNSERIAHELVCKFDQFTRRREDHMRKLLRTLGTDPMLEQKREGGGQGTALHVSPANFHRVCDRFGLNCDEHQAHEIFKSHNLPKEGCNLYTLAKNFLDTSSGELTRQTRRTPGALSPEPRQAPTDRKDIYKLARLPDNAWKAAGKSPTGAAAAPFAVTLPPIGSK